MSSHYDFNSDNIFSKGQFLDKFYREAVEKGVTTGGNANILNTLRSSKNVLGQQPDQAAHLRDYLSTGKVPEGLDPDFAVKAYDYAIREEGRKQQTKSPGFFKKFLKIAGYAAMAAGVIYSGGAALGALKAGSGFVGALGAAAKTGIGTIARVGFGAVRRLASGTVSAGRAILGGGVTGGGATGGGSAGGFWSSTFAQTAAANVITGVGGALLSGDPYEEDRKLQKQKHDLSQVEYKNIQQNYLLPGFDYRNNRWRGLGQKPK